jgi:hypothetical protein
MHIRRGIGKFEGFFKRMKLWRYNILDKKNIAVFSSF